MTDDDGTTTNINALPGVTIKVHRQRKTPNGLTLEEEEIKVAVSAYSVEDAKDTAFECLKKIKDEGVTSD